MNQNLALPCILGETIVSKILSVFSGNILNAAAAEDALVDEINSQIHSTCDKNLATLVQKFFADEDAESTALAFDVNPDHFAELTNGIELKTDRLIASTRKIVILVALQTYSAFEALDGLVHDIISTDCIGEYGEYAPDIIKPVAA